MRSVARSSDGSQADDEQPRRPVPRAWREEFGGLRPVRPIVYRKLTLDAVDEAAREVGNEKGEQATGPPDPGARDPDSDVMILQEVANFGFSPAGDEWQSNYHATGCSPSRCAANHVSQSTVKVTNFPYVTGSMSGAADQ
jgi:hypothetical protein